MAVGMFLGTLHSTSSDQVSAEHYKLVNHERAIQQTYLQVIQPVLTWLLRGFLSRISMVVA